MNKTTKIRLCVLALALSAALCFTGCSVQPTDAVTGANVGGPQSIFSPHPTTNPATGNAIVLKGQKPTGDDVADVVEVTSKTVQSVAPSFGPWGLAVAALLGAATPALTTRLRRKKPATGAEQ